MAVVADGHVVMARFGPGVEMVLHDMAVGAGGGVVGQIGRPLRVNEGVPADPGRGPDDGAQQHSQPFHFVHDPFLGAGRWFVVPARREAGVRLSTSYFELLN